MSDERDRVIAYVRDEYKRYGYVRWSDVADDFACSRQNVHSLIQKAVAAGTVLSSEYGAWAKSYMNTSTRKVKFTPANWEWLEAEAKSQGRRRDDILNELLNLERRFSSTPSQSHVNITDEVRTNS